MAVSPPTPAPRVHIQQATFANSKAVLSLQLDTVENDPFVREVNITSVVSETSAPSATTAVAEPMETRELDREPSQETIPPEGKPHKRRVRPRKHSKQSGFSHREEEPPKRRREKSDSEGEGPGNSERSKLTGVRQGNGQGKGSTDRESKKSSSTRSPSPKGKQSCAIAIAYKLRTVKSGVRRVQPSLQTLSECAVESASPTPIMAAGSSEATPLPTTVGRVRSRVEVVETGVEK